MTQFVNLEVDINIIAMRLNNEELYQFLVEKEILALYHANTVRTSITYFENGGLMSRGLVEENDLIQTSQSSDAADKVLNVWDDIFIDTSDLHTYFRRENHYGPILFELDRELVRNNDFEIWITKNNPIYWPVDSTNEERYFMSVEELRQQWDLIERQRKMITIRNNNHPILFDYVRRIIVDDPRVVITESDNTQTILFNKAREKINDIITEDHQLKGKFTLRTCNNCWFEKRLRL